jgi:hypothetical protein
VVEMHHRYASARFLHPPSHRSCIPGSSFLFMLN